MPKRVLLIGLQSSSVDFDRWPGLTREALERAATEVRSKLEEAGFEVMFCLTDDGATAEAKVTGALERFDPDVVSIGAGVRADPHHLRLFETLINLVHRLAPRARIAFNTNPTDTLESIQRAAQG